MSNLLHFYSVKHIYILNKLSLNQIALETILWIPIKKHIEYNDKGFKITYHTKNNNKHGPHNEYYKSGNIHITYYYINGIKKSNHTLWIYYRDGRVSKREYVILSSS